MQIKYIDEVIETQHYEEISTELFYELKDLFYKRPTFEELKKNILEIENGSYNNKIITDFFVKDLMCHTKIYRNKWCIEDVFNCKELMGYFYHLVKCNKNVYPDNVPLIKNIQTAFRIGGIGVAGKVSNFPLKTVDLILKKYNVNNNYYDFSCGWMARLTGALRNNVNYFGTDPNYILIERIKQYAEYYKKVVNENTLFTKDCCVDVRCQGSEIFVSEWENKIGVAFSSPPYFYLEDYRIGNQSCNINTSYEDWKTGYLTGTIRNIYKYLIDDGYFIMNINNFDKFDLVGDVVKIAENNGFKLYEVLELENIKRIDAKKELNNNNEKIMVFKKAHKVSELGNIDFSKTSKIEKKNAEVEEVDENQINIFDLL